LRSSHSRRGSRSNGFTPWAGSSQPCMRAFSRSALRRIERYIRIVRFHMTTTTQSSWLLKLAQALLLSFAAAAWAQPTPPPIEGEEPSANEIQPEQDAREAPEPPAP